MLFGRNDFYSSGQIPLDLVDEGILNRFGYVDPTDGGRVKLGTVAAYYSKALGNGDTFRADGFLSRSLFDLYANFTYYLNDPIHGDAFQQQIRGCSRAPMRSTHIRTGSEEPRPCWLQA